MADTSKATIAAVVDMLNARRDQWTPDEQCREAASLISALEAERDGLLDKLGRQHDYANMRDWQVAQLAPFAKWVIEESAFFGCDLNGGDVQEKAAAAGLITATTYDPEKHGPTDMAEPGDEWFVFTSTLEEAGPTMDVAALATRAEKAEAERDEARSRLKEESREAFVGRKIVGRQKSLMLEAAAAINETLTRAEAAEALNATLQAKLEKAAEALPHAILDAANSSPKNDRELSFNSGLCRAADIARSTLSTLREAGNDQT